MHRLDIDDKTALEVASPNLDVTIIGAGGQTIVDTGEVRDNVGMCLNDTLKSVIQESIEVTVRCADDWRVSDPTNTEEALVGLGTVGENSLLEVEVLVAEIPELDKVLTGLQDVVIVWVEVEIVGEAGGSLCGVDDQFLLPVVDGEVLVNIRAETAEEFAVSGELQELEGLSVVTTVQDVEGLQVVIVPDVNLWKLGELSRGDDWVNEVDAEGGDLVVMLLIEDLLARDIRHDDNEVADEVGEFGFAVVGGRVVLQVEVALVVILVVFLHLLEVLVVVDVDIVVVDVDIWHTVDVEDIFSCDIRGDTVNEVEL